MTKFKPYVQTASPFMWVNNEVGSLAPVLGGGESAIVLKPNNGWTFASTSVWKNCQCHQIASCALKAHNSIERIQPRITCASFNSNPCITISCYSPTNASDEMDIITFYNELYSLVQHIPKHNILIINGDLKITNSTLTTQTNG